MKKSTGYLLEFKKDDKKLNFYLKYYVMLKDEALHGNVKKILSEK